MNVMNKISKEQYENALARVEELLLLVGEEMSANDPLAMELALVSEMVIAYEKMNHPMKGNCHK